MAKGARCHTEPVYVTSQNNTRGDLDLNRQMSWGEELFELRNLCNTFLARSYLPAVKSICAGSNPLMAQRSHPVSLNLPGPSRFLLVKKSSFVAAQ